MKKKQEEEEEEEDQAEGVGGAGGGDESQRTWNTLKCCHVTVLRNSVVFLVTNGKSVLFIFDIYKYVHNHTDSCERERTDYFAFQEMKFEKKKKFNKIFAL